MGWKLIVAGIAALFVTNAASAAKGPPRITLDIASRSTAFDGRSFGAAGVYERITGIARLEIDPDDPANAGIVDLDHAPRDARGMVRYESDVEILRPRDPSRGSHVLLHEVVNRGRRVVPIMVGTGPGTADDFLMRQGYTLLWTGWQGDLAGPGLIAARLPVASLPDGPITGRIHVDTVFDDKGSDSIALPFPRAAAGDAATLTVRQHADDPERALAAADWRFADDSHVVLRRPADMDAGAIYRLSYVARDPRVAGLGFTATRDLVSWFHHAGAAEGNVLADDRFGVVLSMGISQSARFLRDFLWQGYNRDLAGRRVFDGIFAIISGARRSFTNARFGEPGRFTRQHEEQGVPGFDFPFAYAPLPGPTTGRPDSILARCSADGTCPRIFHADTGGEFWQAGASLVGTGGLDRDVDFPPNVRAYMIAGGAHAPGLTAPACHSPANPLLYGSALRALTIALMEWARDGKAPPPSRWPRLDRGELVRPDALRHPDLRMAGVDWPKVFNRPASPPGGRAWPVLVPVVDADGNDRPGIRLPAVAAPTGTYLPWNLRGEGYAASDLCFVFGGWSPFARDAASRGADPRPSLAERYAGRPRAALLRDSVARLQSERLLLDEDARTILAGD